MSTYSIGIDFGTESARALLVELATGEEVGSVVYPYSHGVMNTSLPVGGEPVYLGPDWALQDPEDYLRALEETLPALLRETGVAPEEVVGVGVDFTSCTMLPVRSDGMPLCRLPAFRREPHAWVKLWKHHAAQPQADRINKLAREREEPWLARYGGRISSEWFFPKVLEILDEAPGIYAATDVFLEAADWIVWQLTGEAQLSACTAGFKAFWGPPNGFPEPAFFAALDPRLEHVVAEKLPNRVRPVGQCAGVLTEAAAQRTGLQPGTAVATALIDAHASVPGAAVTEPGRMVIIMGTSACQMVLSSKKVPVPGIAGVVQDGIIPGLFGYEAGQPSLGDTFAWAARTLAAAPGAEQEAAFRKLEQGAAALRPGASGLLALDWWNGNRSVLDDSELSGLLLGVTLATTSAEIYRALMEASAFGTRVIIEAYESHGIVVHELVACGGLPARSPLLLQVYADVTGRTLKVAESSQTAALGAALYGAVAAGEGHGGYATIGDAVRRAARLHRTYRPSPGHHRTYDRLYAEYRRLYDHFGRGGHDVMHVLKRMRTGAIEKSG